MPWRAATPVPAMIAVGVASPSAQGQAMTSTATAFSVATVQSPCASPQASQVTRAMTMMTGTKTSLTRSTVRWIGALAACASSTRRMMRDSVVSAPTAVARTRSKPSPLMAPAATLSSGPLATGRLSPVRCDWSMWLRPSTTVPSAASRSPARTTSRSPTASRPTARSTTRPSTSTRAVLGRSDCSARMASVVCRLARCSSHLPSITSVMTAAEASK